jgi:hypothetical protein
MKNLSNHFINFRLHLSEVPRALKLRETEGRRWLPGAGGRRKRNGQMFRRYEVSAWEDEQVLEMDSGDGGTTL